MYQFFRSDEFLNFELVRILGTAPYGGCEVAEFLEAASSIKRNDADSWHNAWQHQAELAEQRALFAAANGQRVAARDAFLRAANYFRASQYMMFDSAQSADSRVRPILERSIANFERAIDLFDTPVERVKIPYNGGFLPGYLYLPPGDRNVSSAPPSPPLPNKVPIVVNCVGADSTQEELYHLLPFSGPGLGYAVLTFEGPGQGIVLRRDKTHQRPDWEEVVSPVLDFVETFAKENPSLLLDVDRITIAGASMGAYYALRGASDPRIKACVAIDPFYDLWDLVVSRSPQTMLNLWLRGWIPDSVIDTLTMLQARVSFQSRYDYLSSAWIFGVHNPSMLLRRTRDFTFRLPDGGEFLDRVQCAVLISGATHSLYFPPELASLRVWDRLKHIDESKKELWLPKEPGDGSLQAKVGAFGLLQQRTFAFLDKQFGIKRDSLA